MFRISALLAACLLASPVLSAPPAQPPLAATAAAPAPVGAQPAANPSATHARVLAATCAACHGTDGKSHSAMPGLAGLPAPYLVQQMQDFKSGKRDATVMHQHARGYTDEEIQRMANLFAATKP